MNKAEFLRALDAGLSVASPEERIAAIQFYTEYLDDAGPEREAAVIDELGGPQKVVADILTASALQNQVQAPQQNPPLPPFAQAAPPPQSAWQMPPYPQAPTPPPQWASGANLPTYNPVQSGTYAGANSQGQSYNTRNNNAAKIIAIVLALVFLSPIIGGFGGVLIGVVAVIFSVFFMPLILGVALFFSGIAIIASSLLLFPVSLGNAIFALGCGTVVFGLGLLLTIAGARLLGKVFPAIIRGIFAMVRAVWRKFVPQKAGGQNV